MPSPLIRTQPLGLHPMPVGGLLLPDVSGAHEVATALLRGKSIPDDSAPELAFLRCALADDLTGAQAALAILGNDPVLAFNRFVLLPDPDKLAELRESLSGELRQLLEFVAYAAGLEDEAPALPADPADGLDGELRAFCLTCLATQALEQDDVLRAADLLGEAAASCQDSSPGQSARCSLARVEVHRMVQGHHSDHLDWLRGAIDILEDTGFTNLRAELQLEQAVLLQELPHRHGQIHGFQQSLPLLQDCLRALDRTTHPRTFGFAQTRLGLAYLSMPMSTASDALRMGVAVQALREATETLDPRGDRDLWIPAAINLANAWQLLPSNHQQKNLDGAVDLYTKVLSLRNAQEDPVGHGRVRLNRAHALASLGRAAEAVDDLKSAAAIFGEHGRSDEQSAARELLDSLQRDGSMQEGGASAGGLA